MNSKTLYAAVLAAALGASATVAQAPTLLNNFNTRNWSDSYSGSSSAWAQIGTKGFITFTTKAHGNELWTYDINPANPTPLAWMTENLFPGNHTHVGNPRDQITFNNEVYFTAWDVVYGRELYKTDGTVTGTVLVADIIPGNPQGGPYDSSAPLNFFIYQGVLFFTYDDAGYGTYGLGTWLWKTDGTTVGTVPVDPTNTTVTIGSQIEYLSTSGALFFATAGPAVGGPWSPAPPTSLYALTLGTPDSIVAVDNTYGNISYMCAIGANMYFSGEDQTPLETVGVELYQSNGTTISLAYDIQPATDDDGYPRYITAYNGKLYFDARLNKSVHSTSGYVAWDNELYEWDPATPGTIASVNINSQPYTGYGYTYYVPAREGSSYPDDFVENNGLLFLQADDGGALYGNEMWTMTTAGLGSLACLDVNPGPSNGATGPYPQILNQFKIIFIANDGTNGTELWESDGSTTGTIMCADHNPTGNLSSIKLFGTMGGSNVLMRANNYNGWGTELHHYVGTTTPGLAGTMTAAANVNDPTAFDYSGGFWNSGLGVADLGNGFGMFPVKAEDPITGAPLGVTLWKTDGTVAGTQQVCDVNPTATNEWVGEYGMGADVAAPLGGSLFYINMDDKSATGVDVGQELYFHDGTIGAAAQLVGDVNPGGGYSGGSAPKYMVNAGGGRIVYNCKDGATGSNNDQTCLYWASRNTYGKIFHYPVIGGVPTPTPVYGAQALVYHNGRVYCAGKNDDTNSGTWDIYMTDGTTAWRMTNQDFGSSSLRIVYFDDVAGNIYYVGGWGPYNAAPPAPTVVGNHLYMVDKNFANPPVQLTNEDITPPGTYEPQGSGATQFCRAPNGQLFFGGNSNGDPLDGGGPITDFGAQLWTTDGTVTGTQVFMSINSVTGDAGYIRPVLIDAGMVFSADDGVAGYEVWLSDGTVTGTAMITDTTPGGFPQGGSAPGWMEPVGSRRVVYTYGKYSTWGEEMWTCDGTNPIRVTDIEPNNGDTQPRGWGLQNGLLVFQASHHTIGDELYTMDFGANTKKFGVTSAHYSDNNHSEASCVDPVLGAPYTIVCNNGFPGASGGWSYLGFGWVNGEFLYQFKSVYINPLSYQIVGVVFADAAGNYAFPQGAIPANPAFAGADFVHQAASLPTQAGIFNGRTTNALLMNVHLY